MTANTEVRPVRQSHLPHNGQELPGAPPPDADENVDLLVRSLVVEQKREESPKRLPPLAPPDPAPQAAKEVDGAPRDPAPRRPGKGRPMRLRPTLRRLPRPRLPAALRGVRPKRRHLAFAALALVILLWPLLIPGVLFVAFWLGLIAYLTLGPERCAEIAAGLWARFEARAPRRAERLRDRADRFAERFDRLLDRLPEPWAERLALPDFSASTRAGPERPDPFDRLVSEPRDA